MTRRIKIESTCDTDVSLTELLVVGGPTNGTILVECLCYGFSASQRIEVEAYNSPFLLQRRCGSWRSTLDLITYGGSMFRWAGSGEPSALVVPETKRHAEHASLLLFVYCSHEAFSKGRQRMARYIS